VADPTPGDLNKARTVYLAHCLCTRIVPCARHQAIADLIARERAEATAAERERCATTAEAEEELDGPMPEALYDRCVTYGGAEEVMRAAVQATKKKIAAAIRAGATISR